MVWRTRRWSLLDGAGSAGGLGQISDILSLHCIVYKVPLSAVVYGREDGGRLANKEVCCDLYFM